MAVEARLRVRHRGCVSERVRGRLVVRQLSADGPTSIYVVAGDRPREVAAVERELLRDLAGAEVLDRSPGAVLMRGEFRPGDVCACILGYGCSILWPARFHGGAELYTVVAPSRTRVSHLLERLQDFGSADLLSVGTVRPEDLALPPALSEIATRLTHRQLGALRSAVEAGYYRQPRATSAEALAAGFGVARATFQEHLRKGEAKVLEAVVDALARDPVALGAARVGAGRPARAPKG